jgi:hypothetical protein
LATTRTEGEFVSIHQLDPSERPEEGFDLYNFDVLTDEEKNAELMRWWGSRGPLYQMYSHALPLDYGGTAGAKLHQWASGSFGIRRGEKPRPSDRANGILYSTHTLSSYVMLGWETGIANQFHVLRMRGMSKEQCMEIVMFTQLYAGMRGLGHVYRAIGDFLPAIGPPPVELPLPDGWTADPEAFRSGMDLSTREMTPADRSRLEEWYERNIGYLPASIAFGLKYHPEFVKVNRAKWEVAIRTLPKQFAPHLMLRLNLQSGNADGLREAVLLGRTWGMTKRQIVNGMANTVCFFTGPEGFYTAHKATDDILDAWEDDE